MNSKIEEDLKKLRQENADLKKKLNELEGEIKSHLKECVPIKEYSNEGSENMTVNSVYQYYPKGFKFRHVGHSYLQAVNTSKLIFKQKLERLQKIIKK
jgi:predicted nuclease with TOPRIM domain